MTAMIDLSFGVSGEALPPDYPFALWEALLRQAPPLADGGPVGVLPLRAAEGNNEILLPRRARLVLRLPQTLAHAASTILSGAALDISGRTLRLGTAQLREIQPYPTLHAQLVTGPDDELVFMDEARARLSAMRIDAKLICGRHRSLRDGRHALSGYSLVAHDLKPEASLRLQQDGMGEGRCFGCGIFLPHKAIPDLG